MVQKPPLPSNKKHLWTILQRCFLTISACQDRLTIRLAKEDLEHPNVLNVSYDKTIMYVIKVTNEDVHTKRSAGLIFFV